MGYHVKAASYIVDQEECPLIFVRENRVICDGAIFRPNAMLVEQIQDFSFPDGEWDCRKLGLSPVQGSVSHWGRSSHGVAGTGDGTYIINSTRRWEFAAPTWNVVRILAENATEIFASKDLDLPVPFFLGAPKKETRPTMLLGTFLPAISSVGQLPDVVSYIECDREILGNHSKESLRPSFFQELKYRRNWKFALQEERAKREILKKCEDVEKLEETALKAPIQSGLHLPIEAHFGIDHILGVIQLNSKVNTGEADAQARFDAVLYLVNEPPTSTDVIQLSRTVRFNHPSGLQVRECQLGKFVPNDMKYMD